ncbi:MAG: hypothetical protein V1668_01115 [Patescibacteria group bacterium]
MSPFLFWKNKNENSQGKPKQENSISASTRDYQERKKVFTWLVIFGVLILGFSIWQTSRVLKSPFEKKSTNTSSTKNTVAAGNQASSQTLESLRTKDTDKDGISDYDELYVFQTSPYLSDSDGDGIDDKKEIDQTTDPNCPKDKTCSRQAADTNANSAMNATADLTNGLLTDGTDLTAEQLRAVLRDSGVSETELGQVDDATLMQWYQQVLAEEEGTTNINTVTNSTTSTTNNTVNINAIGTNQTVTYEDLKNLSIADIRSLLEQSGVDKATLDQVDDATLKQIYLDSLAENIQQTATNTNT